MKLSIVIDKNRDEETVIYAHSRSKLVEDIECLVAENGVELVGYIDREAVPLELSEVSCFVVEDNRIFALCGKRRLQIRYRIYQLEEKLPDTFVKINQSCIANIRQIDRFSASVSGSLLVRFKNGFTDCVSRRNVKNVKERLGI